MFRTLKESAASLPPEFAAYKVLSALASALEFGGASAPTIIPLILEFGNRRTRVVLLESLSDYSDKLDKKTVVFRVHALMVGS